MYATSMVYSTYSDLDQSMQYLQMVFEKTEEISVTGELKFVRDNEEFESNKFEITD